MRQRMLTCSICALLAVAFVAIFAAIGGAESRSQASMSEQVTSTSAAMFDRHIAKIAERDKLAPTTICSDATFLRRATIDLIGRIPTAEEYAAYMRDDAKERRARLVDRLIADPRFVDRWTVFFGDMLRIRSVGDAGQALTVFVRDSLKKDKPYDEMVKEMLLATGTPGAEPAAGFLAAEKADPLIVAGVVSQELLGVRMNCAQCHDHPFDVWSQEDYYGLAAFFSRTGYHYRIQGRVERVMTTQEPSVFWPPKSESGKDRKPMAAKWPLALRGDPAAQGPTTRPAGANSQSVFDRRNAKRAHRASEDSLEALMKETAASTPSNGGKRGSVNPGMDKDLEQEAQATTTDADRATLTRILTSPRNRYFAWNIVNRVWAEMLGRGIVEPVDDFRNDNPPSNPELLDALADEFIAGDYSVRQLVRSIAMTQAYQRERATGITVEQRHALEKRFLAASLRRVPAEALYDSIVTAGHLSDYKHPRGTHMKEVAVTIEVRKDDEMMMSEGGRSPNGDMSAKKDEEATRTRKVISAYGAESAVSIDDLLTQPAEREAATAFDMREHAMMVKQVEAYSMRTDEDKEKERNEKYERKTVIELHDLNPRFSYATEMAAPAPLEHFLRQFGQPGRTTLGDKRFTTPSMRQALILLNGQLVNEAANVGRLEPMGTLLVDDKAPIEPAINHAYLEILTRKPTADEMTKAIALVKAGETRAAGVADLRWTLLNSLEFRYLP